MYIYKKFTMACKNCSLDKPLVNKHFKLCLECNNIRLHGNVRGKQYKGIERKFNLNTTPKNKSKKSLFVKQSKKKTPDLSILEDEIFYEVCFNNSDHRCEECGAGLPTEFSDDGGNVIARWRYSHILPKSTHSSLRHELLNINHLCLMHHIQWDHGDKKSMKIYEKNQKIITKLLNQ